MNTDYFKKKLDVFKILLNGINLIEASAGTGKTFTIVLLYLRLLLGIGNKQKKLLVHQILVVTFTNTAKEELYIRIKNGIQNLYFTCINKTTSDPILELFLREINDIDEAVDILNKAQNDINHSSIYTIHSFCQKILQWYTFDYNIIFKDEIIENEDDLYLQATEDFWRRFFYNLPENIVNVICQDYNSPENLLKKIKPLLHIKSINFKKRLLKNETLLSYHENNIKKINNFKEIWLNNYRAISRLMYLLKINKKIYSKFNLSRWINDITIWAKSETKDYTLPIALKYFSKNYIEKNTTNNISSEYIIFKETEKILNNNFSLKKIIILNAIKNINRFLLKEKKNQSLLSFNDLLSILLETIKKNQYLRELIRKKYPAAFIDEFQDTNIEQYKIFDLLYKKNEKTVLFLIGDPKQAIYSFRGADIFSYLYAKSKIKKHYYLDTNWRSSTKMCKSINFLFSQHNNPFIFKNLSFKIIKSSYKNSKMDFVINKTSQIPIKFFLQEQKEVYIDDYQVWISKQCANEISYWLACAKEGNAIIKTKKGEKTLTYKDIAILVRNQKEANLITQELKKLNIMSIYSSYKDSIFQIFDAQELLWILKSILEPDNENLLKQSISTHILKKINNKEKSFLIIEKLYEYNNIWQKIGIFNMIKTMILEYQMNSNIIDLKMYYEKNLNFLHIAELLEEKFQFFDKKESLIRWFQKKILAIKQPSHNERIRSLSESQSIKIVTIHKAKGLEYPIVWIPFSIDFNQSKLPVYHKKENFKVFFDTEKNQASLKISDKERLAEDVRFLYVALTRAIVHCSIGIACLIKQKIKNRDYSDIHNSGLGYIIQNGKIMNYKNLFDQLSKLSMNNFIEVQNSANNSMLSINKKNIHLISKRNMFKEHIHNIWKVISFTKLKKENKSSAYEQKEIILDNALNIKKNQKLTVHNFPTGKKTGIMIHYILRNLHDLNEKKYDWFSKILEKYNISSKWTPILMSWVENIINTPLNNENIVLSKINKKLCIKELEFFLPIKNILYSTELNKTLQSSDSISILSPKLSFDPIKGILTGSIDLLFCWKKKYYIIDYKSNWLGNNNSIYSDENIKKEIINQRYDLQYQIYTVAVHTYLQKKIKYYNYRNNFGGVFYIFLRAVNNQKKNNGVFHTIPNFSLIEKIIDLIS
ncbi:exodeoxyribonuclease V subunit beta [Buchnera aphidicola (Hyperomyzus lactucae)]|uniref:RecBCD enzyme subunit RecB n=1 Tax=Buchnera aphidicola (Hyperomyzus lactucae) TaxID=1241860 RepID=A0A4D6XYG4_9GAMM|nr:exodeoxyribonuclease V subunit beta [Buchnera aphidicola]QCI21167.1 exodeoxyribonuclease V subunit beta [Buchnera aphidicola (Hyperomyzus lactucae)]